MSFAMVLILVFGVATAFYAILFAIIFELSLGSVLKGEKPKSGAKNANL